MAGTAASNRHINYWDLMETSYEAFLHMSYIHLAMYKVPYHYTNNRHAVTPQLDGTNPKESPLCFRFVVFLI